MRTSRFWMFFVFLVCPLLGLVEGRYTTMKQLQLGCSGVAVRYSCNFTVTVRAASNNLVITVRGPCDCPTTVQSPYDFGNMSTENPAFARSLRSIPDWLMGTIFFNFEKNTYNIVQAAAPVTPYKSLTAAVYILKVAAQKGKYGHATGSVDTLCTGQNETIDATLTQSFLSSPGYTDGEYYPNLAYDYRISTNITNHTVLVTVIDCEIESVVIKGVSRCVTDYFSVYDGYNESFPVLEDKYCCLTTPFPSYSSTGDTLYIVFTTDGTDQFKGFRMTVQSDSHTTTTTTSTTTTTPTTQALASSGGSKKSYKWIIVGCCIGGVNLIVIIVIVVICFVKKPTSSTTPREDHVTNRILWSRANTVVEPISTKAAPPGEVVQTNIFDMKLPAADGKGGQLPPLGESLTPAEKERSFNLT